MTTYKYGSVLEVQNDDPHPDSDVEAGDCLVRAGKHPDGGQYEVLDEQSVVVVELETIAVYEADRRLSESQMIEFVREKAAEDPEVDLDG